MRGFNIRRSHDFEHTRAIVHTLCSIYRDPKTQPVPIEKFWPLPTDDLESAKKEEEKEANRLGDKLKRFKQSKKYKI